MYPDSQFPEDLVVSDEELIKEFRRRKGLDQKFECLDRWLRSNRIEILIWDTINSILATGEPNSEVSVSRFFDALAILPQRGAALVRHDGKPSKDSENRHSNQLVRGSNRLVEDASGVIHLNRLDKAKNKVCCTVGKLRHGSKPDPMELWFDSGTFRLTPLHPVAALLESAPCTRKDLIELAGARFNLRTRAIDAEINQLRSLLIESSEGHKRVFALNQNAVPEPESAAARWWSLVRRPEGYGGETQGCISLPGIPQEDRISCGLS
jgi:hypothetical protein